MTFQDEGCKASGNVDHHRSRLSALLDTCLLFPYKLRSHGLCGAEPTPEMEEEGLPTWFDPEILVYPLPCQERKRRVHEIFLRLLQYCYTNWSQLHETSQLEIGLDAELQFACHHKTTTISRQDVETDEDDVASWGSGWTDEQKQEEWQKSYTQGNNRSLYQLFQPIPTSCAKLTPHRKIHNKLILGADKRLRARIWNLYSALNISVEAFKAVLALLLPFQVKKSHTSVTKSFSKFTILEETVLNKVDEKISISETDFLETAMVLL